jgi:hypothetical protein
MRTLQIHPQDSLTERLDIATFAAACHHLVAFYCTAPLATVFWAVLALAA